MAGMVCGTMPALNSWLDESIARLLRAKDGTYLVALFLHF